jgi:hypothetical protein
MQTGQIVVVFGRQAVTAAEHVDFEPSSRFPRIGEFVPEKTENPVNFRQSLL